MQIHFLLLNIYCYFFCCRLKTANSDKLVVNERNFTLPFRNTLLFSAEVLFFSSELADMHLVLAVKMLFCLLRKSQDKASVISEGQILHKRHDTKLATASGSLFVDSIGFRAS